MTLKMIGTFSALSTRVTSLRSLFYLKCLCKTVHHASHVFILVFFRRRSESTFVRFLRLEIFKISRSYVLGWHSWTSSHSQETIAGHGFLILLSLPGMRIWQPLARTSFRPVVMKNQRYKCHPHLSCSCKATSESHWHPGYGRPRPLPPRHPPPPRVCNRLV